MKLFFGQNSILAESIKSQLWHAFESQKRLNQTSTFWFCLVNLGQKRLAKIVRHFSHFSSSLSPTIAFLSDDVLEHQFRCAKMVRCRDYQKHGWPLLRPP